MILDAQRKTDIGDEILAHIMHHGKAAIKYIELLNGADFHPSRQFIFDGIRQLQAEKKKFGVYELMTHLAGGKESVGIISAIYDNVPSFADSTIISRNIELLKGDLKDIEPEKVWEPEKVERGPYPDFAIKAPGILGDVCKYFNRTSVKDQPLFAVPVALTCVSAAIGRNYMLELERGSFSSIWNIILAPAGAGKEHPQTIINAILAQSGLSSIIGPSTPNSDSALVSMLCDQPRVCVVADEYQAILQDAAQNNSYSYAALSEMRKVWGKCSDVLIPKGLSHRGAGKEKKGINQAIIKRPALTFFAVAQTRRVKQVMNRKLIHDGTMSRFQLIISDEEGKHVVFKVGREKSQHDIPTGIKDWFTYWGNTHNDNMGTQNDDPQNPPNFTRVPFECEESAQLLTDFSKKVRNDSQKLSTDYKIGELGSRKAEICCRIILCATIACTLPGKKPKVTKEIVEWAIAYVNFHWEREIKFYIESVGGTTEHGEQREIILEAIKLDTENFGGMKVRKLIRGTGAAREVKNIPKRTREAIIEDLVAGALVREQNIVSKSGQKIKAYVALDPQD